MSDANQDDELLANLRDAVVAADPPPAGLRDAAIRALTWDTESEWLTLQFDSALESAGMRSSAATRDLTFGLDEIVVEISVTAGDDGTTILDGSIVGETESVLLVQPESERRPLEIDGHGRFRVTVTGSVAGILVATAGGKQLRTELFSLDPGR